jgi:membrane-bound lytic murein transglycosylase B
MLNRPPAFFLAFLVLTVLPGCAPEAPKPPAGEVTAKPTKPKAHLTGDAGGRYQAKKLTGDFRGYPQAEAFVARMVETQGFTREYLYGVLSQAKRKTWTIEYMNREKPTVKQKPGGWTRYRAKFLDDRHMNAGVQFWNRHATALRRAEETYGVPPEAILGIMGVETIYGANVGNHRVIDALSTLAFDYPRRADYFESELESLLIMARQEGMDPSKPQGSFAGAMGLGQFMPSSFLKYAVDFDGDGRVDLWDPEDAVGSIAHYFAEFGWQSGQPVVSHANVAGNDADSLKSGFDTRYTLDELESHGIRPTGRRSVSGPVSLLKLSAQGGEEYRIGYPNFYVITRYNHSTYYAMAVYELGQAIRQRRGGSD